MSFWLQDLKFRFSFFLFLFVSFVGLVHRTPYPSSSIESSNRVLGPVSRKSRELFGPEKPFVKVRPAYSAKLVFSYVVKGVKIKITAKFRASRRFRFEDTKRIMSPEIRPKSFGTFEKQAPGVENRAEQFKVQYLNNNDYYCDFVRFSFVGLNRCVSNTLSSSIEESKMLMEDTSERLEALVGLKAVQWINGPVGSGKSWILKEKVKDLSGSRSGEQILVVCFNKPFSKSLKEEFKDCSGVVVKVFNELLFEITKKRCGSDQEMQESINEAVEILARKTPEYDHIFVDECEDLIGEKWPVLFQKMWKGNEEVPGCKCKWFFYDTNQCGGWSDEGHRTAFPTSVELTRVLRTTGNIFDQCKKYLDTEKIMLGPEDCGLNIQWQPSLPSREVTVSEGAGLVAECIDDLRKEKVSEVDVCVLVQNEEIRNQLSSELKGLRVDNHNAEEQFEGNHKNKVVVESIRRFKGLKSRVVILYNPEFALAHNSHIRQLLYTAFSRCTCYLVVITTNTGVASLKSERGFGLTDHVTINMFTDMVALTYMAHIYDRMGYVPSEVWEEVFGDTEIDLDVIDLVPRF